MPSPGLSHITTKSARRGVRVGRRSTIGNRVYVKSVPRVRISSSPPVQIRGLQGRRNMGPCFQAWAFSFVLSLFRLKRVAFRAYSLSFAGKRDFSVVAGCCRLVKRSGRSNIQKMRGKEHPSPANHCGEQHCRTRTRANREVVRRASDKRRKIGLSPAFPQWNPFPARAPPPRPTLFHADPASGSGGRR